MTTDQKLANREFSSQRIIVESTLSHMKHFRVLAERFRQILFILDYGQAIRLTTLARMRHNQDQRRQKGLQGCFRKRRGRAISWRPWGRGG